MKQNHEEEIQINFCLKVYYGYIPNLYLYTYTYTYTYIYCILYTLYNVHCTFSHIKL